MNNTTWLVAMGLAAGAAWWCSGCGDEFAEQGTATPTGGSGGTSTSSSTAGGGGADSCTDQGDACTQCALAQCHDDYCACEQNPDCWNLADCLRACPASDQACAQACWTQFPSAISAGALATHCAGGVCADDCTGFSPLPGCNECVFRQCGAAMDACLPIPECTDLVFCGLGCAVQADVGACVAACFTQYPGAATEGQAVWDCLLADCDTACPWAQP